MITHLTEADRQGAADDTLSPERRAVVAAHIAGCAACAADVNRLRALLARVGAAPRTAEPAAGSWRDVEARIQRGKLAELPGASYTEPLGRRPLARGRSLWLVAAVAAMLVIAFLSTRRAGPVAAFVSSPDDSAPLAMPAADSSPQYERRAAELLNDLEMRRSILRPGTSAAIDGDLRVVDRAIAEVKDALTQDPNNPALRQLLASAYRQKLDILRRVGNAS